MSDNLRRVLKKYLPRHIGHNLTVLDSAEWHILWCNDCETKIYMGRKP